MEPVTFDLRRCFADPAFMTTTYESPLLDVWQTAEYLNRKLTWVRQVLRYEIPIVKLGERVYFEKRELDAYIAMCREEPAR